MKPSERLITFIESSVNAAKPRDGKRTEYRIQDTRRMIMAGLVLEVLPPAQKGAKPGRAWRVHYDIRQDGKRKRRKCKIGGSSTSLETVFKNWRRVRDIIDDNGRDFVAEERAKKAHDELEDKRRITFGECAQRYLDEHARPNNRTWKTDEYRLNKYILPEMGSVDLAAVQKQDVRRLTKAISDNAPVQADRVRQLISSVYSFAARHDIVAVNPAKDIGAYQTNEKQREPVLPDALCRLWPLLEEKSVSLVRWRAYLIGRIAFLTGLRISEVIGAQKDELDDLAAPKPIWKLK